LAKSERRDKMDALTFSMIQALHMRSLLLGVMINGTTLM
jgi:hypothetical protein